MDQMVRSTDRWPLVLALALAGQAAGAELPALIQSDEVGLTEVRISLPQALDSVRWQQPQTLAATSAWQWRAFNDYTLIEVRLPDAQAPSALSFWTFVGETATESFQWQVRIDPALSVIGPIERGQTLWSIANQWRDLMPTIGLSMDETLAGWVAINPHAFVDADPTSLQQGALLYRPDQAALLIDPSDIQAEQNTLDEGLVDELKPLPVEPAWVDGWWQTERMPSLATIDPAPDGFTKAQQASEPPRSWLSQDPQTIATIAWPILAVVVALMVLHGGAKLRFARARRIGEGCLLDHDISGDPEVELALANHSFEINDHAQAHHWLEDVIGQGSARQVREAKRKRQSWMHRAHTALEDHG